MAQHACEYKLPRHSERGLMLTEHRRCYDGIIGYCNELAYHGDLEPKRGAKKDTHFLPELGYFHINGFSKPRGGSRENEPEAMHVARWLSANRVAIENHYEQLLGKRTSLELLVGIITPFVLQKRALITALRECGLNTMLLKVGTVHALQGAERPIVIFSPVHASNEPNSSLFFDRGINMLNVAVSRAQDSFLVFGDMSIFSRFPNAPSGLLGKYLFSKKENALAEMLPV